MNSQVFDIPIQEVRVSSRCIFPARIGLRFANNIYRLERSLFERFARCLGASKKAAKKLNLEDRESRRVLVHSLQRTRETDFIFLTSGRDIVSVYKTDTQNDVWSNQTALVQALNSLYPHTWSLTTLTWNDNPTWLIKLSKDVPSVGILAYFSRHLKLELWPAALTAIDRCLVNRRAHNRYRDHRIASDDLEDFLYWSERESERWLDLYGLYKHLVPDNPFALIESCRNTVPAWAKAATFTDRIRTLGELVTDLSAHGHSGRELAYDVLLAGARKCR